jgi:hypothetical protein
MFSNVNVTGSAAAVTANDVRIAESDDRNQRAHLLAPFSVPQTRLQQPLEALPYSPDHAHERDHTSCSAARPDASRASGDEPTDTAFDVGERTKPVKLRLDDPVRAVKGSRRRTGAMA